MSRLDRHLRGRWATQRPDADEPPDGSRGSGLAAAGELVCTRSAQTSYSRRSAAATRLCCAWYLRVWCFSAPPSPVVLASDVRMWAHAASSCRRARTTTSLPGRGAGRLLAHRRDDWYLSRSCPATGPCRSPPLTCPCAQLASRAAHRCSPGSVCARATQGSETLLCAAGLTRLFASCAYWYMRGFHRWCGWQV